MKLSSPYLNIVFIIGVSMIYLLVVILGVDDNLVSVSVMSGFCQATVWIGVIAFTLVYGVVLAKTFKVLFIFKNIKVAKPNQKKVSMRNSYLCFQYKCTSLSTWSALCGQLKGSHYWYWLIV